MATKKKNVDSAKKSTAKKASRSAKTNTKKVAGKAAAPKTGAKKVALKKKPADKKTAPVKKATSIRAKDQKSMTKKAIVKKTTTVKKAAPATGQKVASSKKAKPAATQKAAVPKTESPKVIKKVAAPKKETKQPQASQNHKPEKEVMVPTLKTVSSSRSSSTKPPRFVYKPEPSILDIPKDNGPRRRYSDNELQEFKDLIQHKLEAARKELVYLQGLITRKDEAGTDDTENKYMGVEDGGGTMEREQLSQLASRQIQYIDHLEKALVRIENKTYGICRETGRLIDKARLRAVPHATLSIEAKLAKKK